jgi:hypothetical protein
MIPQQEIDRIKAQYDIVSVVKRFIELDSKNTACCPFHNEKSGSFKVNPNLQSYKCFGCGAGGDIFSFVQAIKAVNFKEACEIITGHVIEETAKVVKNGRIIRLSDAMADGKTDEKPELKQPKRVNKFAALWESRVEKFTDEYVESVAINRGIDQRAIQWLKQEKLIGLFNGHVAFPVFEDNEVVRCHVKDAEKNTWYYDPKGGGNSALIIGDPKLANTTFILESQWDAFAIMSSLRHWEHDAYYAYICTRGASSNTDVSTFIGKTSRIIAIAQNDPDDKKDKDGKTPAQKWLERVKASIPAECMFSYSQAPEGFEDPNDWIAKESPSVEAVTRQFIELAVSPHVLPFFRITDLLDFPFDDDPDAMIGTRKRWLCRGGSMVLIAPSGSGKSTLMASMALTWATGRDWNGIDCRRPLRQIIVQAENDKGDVAEMVKGAVYGMNKKKMMRSEHVKLLDSNVIFIPVSGVTGADFVKALERQIMFHRADVVWIDPALSYIGGDISKQEISSNFFRVLIDPMLKRTGAIAIVIHHTGKPEKQDGKHKVERSVKEFAYSGLGSSDMVNWVRAVCVLQPTQEKRKYRLMFCKRESRTGVIDFEKNKDVDTIYLEQGGPDDGLSWTLCEAPIEDAEPISKKEAGMMDFKGITFPLMWNDFVRAVQTAKALSFNKALALARKAAGAGVVVKCLDDGRLWELAKNSGDILDDGPRPEF